MLHLMQAMLPALERPQEVSALYLDSIFLAVRDHIAEAYGGFTTRATSNRLGLTARQLRHALEYIEANLSQDAQRIIYESAMPLNEVAISCGFVDQSHLTRVFVRHVGSSPAVWRRNAQR